MSPTFPIFDGDFFLVLAIVKDTEKVVVIAVSSSQTECLEYIRQLVSDTGAYCPFSAFQVEGHGGYIPPNTERPTHSGSAARN